MRAKNDVLEYSAVHTRWLFLSASENNTELNVLKGGGKLRQMDDERTKLFANVNNCEFSAIVDRWTCEANVLF